MPKSKGTKKKTRVLNQEIKVEPLATKKKVRVKEMMNWFSFYETALIILTEHKKTT